ncbi:flippase [Alteromonas oceanisediminis]|uniref:flippase n=1 Tax=Alteromonas oceanisediminis TaxID=2836180 RepID=UPI001BDA6034|nr:flippase [Alteromonas oceanisediminis]MBT0587612.1 flippase [Alteromonas oceanisediminis]
MTAETAPTTLNRVLKNTSWLTLEKVASMGLSFFVTMVIARQLGPEAFGQLNFLLAGAALIPPLASLGMNAIITRELLDARHTEDTILSTTCVFRLLASIASASLCVLIVASTVALTPAEWTLLVCLALASSTYGLQALEFWFQAHMNIRPVVMCRFAFMAGFAAAKVAVALATQSFLLVGLLFAAELVFIGAVYWLLYTRYQRHISFSHVNWHYGVALFKQSFWLVLSGFAAIIYLKIDQLMLASMTTRAEVGIYSAAVRLSEVWYFFATAFVTAIFPALLSLRKKNEARYQKRLQQSCNLLFGAALLIAIVIASIAPWLVNLLFGPAFNGSALVLQLHVWAGVFIFVRALASKWLIAEHLLQFSLLSHGVGAVINVLLNLVLIPLYGGVGAAIATLVSYAVAGYGVFWLAKPTRPMARVITQSFNVVSALIDARRAVSGWQQRRQG